VQITAPIVSRMEPAGLPAMLPTTDLEVKLQSNAYHLIFLRTSRTAAHGRFFTLPNVITLVQANTYDNAHGNTAGFHQIGF